MPGILFSKEKPKGREGLGVMMVTFLSSDIAMARSWHSVAAVTGSGGKCADANKIIAPDFSRFFYEQPWSGMARSERQPITLINADDFSGKRIFKILLPQELQVEEYSKLNKGQQQRIQDIYP